MVADFLFAVDNVPLGGRTPVVLFEHNVEYLIWQRLAASRRGRGAVRCWKSSGGSCAPAKRTPAAQADLTIAVSEDDRRRLAGLAPGDHVPRFRRASTPTTSRPSADRSGPAHLVFSGSMDWHPNEDAVLYFLEAILPSIRATIPEMTFTVVGRNPTARLRAAAERAGVEVTGTVDDVRPSIAEAAVYVVPLRAGGGTRLKIFEALAMGKAVVSTTVGAEGLAHGPDATTSAPMNRATFADAVVVLAARSAAPAPLGRPAARSSRRATRGRRSAESSNDSVRGG